MAACLEDSGRTRVVARAGDRLRDFVSQRASKFSHYAHAVHVGEISLQFAERLFRPLALRQIGYESDTLVSALLEGRRREENGNTAAVFPEVLLPDRRPSARHLVLIV